RRLAGADTAAVYDSQSGHMLFVRQGTLLAQPFNLRTLALAGEPFPIAERVESSQVPGIAAFSVSTNGILVYGVGTGTAGGLQMARVSSTRRSETGNRPCTRNWRTTQAPRNGLLNQAARPFQ